MSQKTATESLVERIDGIEIESTEISGIAEVGVYIDESELPDEIDQIRSWVEHAVEDDLERELSEAGHSIRCQARASDVTEDDPVLNSDLGPSESRYSVWVRFE
jgi:hypothetical protein